MPEPLAGLICVPRVEENRDHAEHVWWASQQECDNVVIPQCSHDGGEEVCHGSSGHIPKEQNELGLSARLTPSTEILTKTHILISWRASLKPCHKVCSSLLVQSSEPMSSSRRQVASAVSSSVNHEVVRGKLGRTQKAAMATAMVITPSIRNSHRHALQPRSPSKLPVIPAEMRPENAPEIKEPVYR